MRCPAELNTDAPMLWSPGTGRQVWGMLSAAAAGDVPKLRALLAAEPKLARATYCYLTPLHFAVRENHVAAARLLLERGANPLCFSVGDSMLQMARDRGYGEMETLLTLHLEQERNASDRGAPVAAAIRAGDRAELERLLDLEPALVNVGDPTGTQPIHWAAMTRQLDVIDELLRRGAKLEAARGSDQARAVHLTNGDYHYRGWRGVPGGAAPDEVLAHLRRRGARLDLNLACALGEMDLVRQMLAEDPDAVNRVTEHTAYYGGSGVPIANAAAQGHLEIVKLLLEHGADPSRREEGHAPRGKALYEAVVERHTEIVKLLLEHGASASAPVESSGDAMTRAINAGDGETAELLASYGAVRAMDVLAYYGDVRTAAALFAVNPALADDTVAFETAAQEGQEMFLRLMLRYQPDIARRSGTAASTRELTEFLFAAGMSAQHTDWLGVTVLHRLAARGDVAMAELFLDQGARLDAREETMQSTPLAWAARAGRREMVEFLLQCGAAARLPDDPPWATAEAWAERRGHGEIVALLRSRG